MEAEEQGPAPGQGQLWGCGGAQFCLWIVSQIQLTLNHQTNNHSHVLASIVEAERRLSELSAHTRIACRGFLSLCRGF